MWQSNENVQLIFWPTAHKHTTTKNDEMEGINRSTNVEMAFEQIYALEKVYVFADRDRLRCRNDHHYH